MNWTRAKDNINKKWTSASDYRYMDCLSSSLARQMYSKGCVKKLVRYFERHLDQDLARDEVIIYVANKIKTLLLNDCCDPRDLSGKKTYIRKLLNSHIKNEIKLKKLYDFERKSPPIDKIISPILLRAFSIFFCFKVIFFYFIHLACIIFCNYKVRSTSINTKLNIVIGDDDLLSGVGGSYAKVLDVMDTSHTLVFSPETYIKRKKEFLDLGFYTFDVGELRSAISPKQYCKIISKDVRMFFCTIKSIWGNPEFSLDCYKFMVRMMTWRLFYSMFSFSKVVKFMIRTSSVDSYFSRLGNAKLCFVYFSITPNPISSEYPKRVYGNLDYCNMSVDYILCDSISNKMFSELNEKYHHVPVKPFRPFALNLDFSSSREKIIFMDNTWGFAGVNSINAMILFFETIMKVIIENKYDVRIKLKKNNFSFYEALIEKAHVDYIERFKIIKRYIEPLITRNLSSSECMDQADLIVSSPLSSVIYEAISSRCKVIVFDPLAECKENEDFIKTIGGIYYDDDTTLMHSISHTLCKSFDEYLRANKIQFIEYPEFKDVCISSPMILRNAIADV